MATDRPDWKSWQRLLGVVLLLLAVWLVLFVIGAESEHFTAEFYPDTALQVMPGMERWPIWGYVARPGWTVLQLSRGRGHSLFTSGHGGGKTLSIEWPSQPSLGKLNLKDGKVKVGLADWNEGGKWVISEKGVEGYLDIEAVGANGVMARYDIVVNAYGKELLPDRRHQQFRFQGRSGFVRSRYEDNYIAADGKLFPE